MLFDKFFVPRTFSSFSMFRNENSLKFNGIFSSQCLVLIRFLIFLTKMTVSLIIASYKMFQFCEIYLHFHPFFKDTLAALLLIHITTKNLFQVILAPLNH